MAGGLRGLEHGEAEQVVASLDKDGQGEISWGSLKAAVDDAATPVDSRVRPIYATLTLLFTSQGTQFPVLPQLGPSRAPAPTTRPPPAACRAAPRPRPARPLRAWQRAASTSTRRTSGC